MSEIQKISASIKEKLAKFSISIGGGHDQKGQGGKNNSQTGEMDEIDTGKTDPGSRLQEGRASSGPFGVK